MGEHSHHHQTEHGGAGFFSREAVSGMPWMVAGKMVLFFLYFGISILTVNALGQEQFGTYSLMTNISSYLLLFCGLGLGAALMRYIPELAARKNRFGLIHLLWKSAALQLIAVVSISLLVVFLSTPLQRLFNAEHVEHFDLYLKLACGLTALLLLKDFVSTVFTSFFKIRVVSLLSVAQGLIWFMVLAVWLGYTSEIGTVFFAQMFSIFLMYLLGAVFLFRYVRELPWESREFGIGKKRALSFSGTVMLSSILRMVMFKYSEIFFIAAVGGTTLAGIYDLGYTLPYTLITFIPLALLSLFTSAFAEAYVKDRNCLGRLISSYYKVLMMVSLPVGILGTCLSPAAYHIIYSGKMDAAGPLASAFCIVLLLPLVSMPLSAAIKAREKVLNMVPMLVLQIVVNLLLDWLLIVKFKLGVWGGVGAVVGTFVLTIPFRLFIVRRIIGGIHFPMYFFLRITTTLLLLAGSIRWIIGKVGLFDLFDGQLINVGLLLTVGGCYLLLFLLAVRYLHLVRKEDIVDFQALEIRKLNLLLRFLVKS
ncbi:MAG: oligosaccharide flippase family protein [Kiritimatiellaceae bacterium]|nr:oligosaccharide flippase family protein [Kiritimatiellaceae bacterium]